MYSTHTNAFGLCVQYSHECKITLCHIHMVYVQSHSCGDLRGVTGGDDKIGCLSGKAGTNRVVFVVMNSPIYLGVWSII